MNIDQHFGSLESRELHLRWLIPFAFESWDGTTFVFRWRNLLDPRRWFRAVRARCNYDFWCRRYPDSQHRCYCPTGWSLDGKIEVAGFGVLWFYSHFTGKVPCICDEITEQFFPSEPETDEANS